VFLAFDRWVHLGEWFAVITGVALIATVISYPEGLAAAGHDVVARVPRLRRGRVPEPPAAPASLAPAVPLAIAERPPELDTTSTLAAEHVTVRYGGVVAVDDVSLRVDAGKVVGLIGPNGAGKTSLIDAVTGFAAASGTVTLEGEAIDSLPVHTRVRKGLARTFQALELYEDLTVEENVSAAVFSTAHEDRHRQVQAALDRAGLGAVRDRRAGDLSQGERQLVSIARACASVPTVLLLDEPAAGLDPADSARLGARIRDIASTGTAVLLVDHDIALVLGTCDYIYVLDFGKLILEGDPATIRADRGLAEAYLGSLHDVSAGT
jgi:sulfate-transporting ATPase